MLQINKDKFIEISAIVDSFVEKMKQSQPAHNDLVISYRKDSKNLNISLAAHVQFKSLQYAHSISWACESDLWHIDDKPIDINELTSQKIIDALKERFNIFQSATLHAIKFLNAFCEKNKWQMEVYTPKNISMDSIVIIIMQNIDPRLKPFITIHLHQNENFGDINVHGIMFGSVFHEYKMAYEFKFSSMEAFQAQIRFEFEQLQPTTMQTWTVIGKIATVLEHLHFWPKLGASR